MTQKDELFLMRHKKKILLKDIAQFIGCSVPTLSNYENGRCKMNIQWEAKYQEFIENY